MCTFIYGVHRKAHLIFSCRPPGIVYNDETWRMCFQKIDPRVLMVYRLVCSAMFTTLGIIAISRLHTLLYFYTWWVSHKHLTLIIGNVFWGNWSSVIFLCRWTFLLATVYFWVGNILNFHWVPLCIPMNLTLIHAFTKNHIRRSLPQGCPSTDGERSQVWMDKGAYEG
jgi:hypothetical protein